MTYRFRMVLIGALGVLLFLIGDRTDNLWMSGLGSVAGLVFLVLFGAEVRSQGSGEYSFVGLARVAFIGVSVLLAALMISGDHLVTWSLQQSQLTQLLVGCLVVTSMVLLLMAGLVTGALSFVLRPYPATTAR